MFLILPGLPKINFHDIIPHAASKHFALFCNTSNTFAMQVANNLIADSAASVKTGDNKVEMC